MAGRIQGRFQSFGQRVARWRVKQAKNFWLQGDVNFYRGVPGTYLLTLLYIIFSRYKLAFFYPNIADIQFNFHLKEHLLNRLSLKYLWYDLSFCVNATFVPQQFKIPNKLNHYSSTIGVKNLI